MELLLRLTYESPPLFRVQTQYFGAVIAENSVGFNSREGFALTHYGKWGEIYTPFSGNKNIIVLGDSFTQGAQVPDKNKFVSIAETIVHAKIPDLDLHNFGWGESDIADYVAKIPFYRMLFNPEAIVIQISESDFLESFREDKDNHFVIRTRSDIELISRTSIQGVNIDSSVKYPHVFPITGYLGLTRISELLSKNVDTYYKRLDKSKLLSSKNVDEIHQDSSNDINRLLILELLEECDGIPLIFILLPDAPFISGDQIIESDPPYANLKALFSEYPEIIIVDPLPEFNNLINQGRLPRGFSNSTYPGTGHLNIYGNQIVGELLAETISGIYKK